MRIIHPPARVAQFVDLGKMTLADALDLAADALDLASISRYAVSTCAKYGQPSMTVIDALEEDSSTQQGAFTGINEESDAFLESRLSVQEWKQFGAFAEYMKAKLGA